jgi:hypothetical protein
MSEQRFVDPVAPFGPYLPAMNTHLPVSPRARTIIDRQGSRREGPAPRYRAGILLTMASSVAIATAIGACTPGASALPSVALPSVAVPPLASAATQAALTALDRVDSAITANQSPSGLSTDDVASLKTLTADVRTRLRSGDMPSARTAFNAVSSKVDEVASKLNSDAGTQLKDAVAALGKLIPGS